MYQVIYDQPPVGHQWQCNPNIVDLSRFKSLLSFISRKWFIVNPNLVYRNGHC